MSRPDSSDSVHARLQFAFTDGATFSRTLEYYSVATGSEIQTRVYRFTGQNRLLGMIHLPTGRIIAADPLTSLIRFREQFEYSVRPGHYPVILTVARDERGHERVAFARIQFARAHVDRWCTAITIETKKRRLPIQAHTGYGVDSALGCFADRSTADWLARHHSRARQDELEAAIERHASCKGLGAIITDPAPGAQCTLAVFRSGLGDGVYESHWGLTGDAKAVCLLTDFNLAGPPPNWGRPARSWRSWAGDWLTRAGIVRDRLEIAY